MWDGSQAYAIPSGRLSSSLWISSPLWAAFQCFKMHTFHTTWPLKANQLLWQVLVKKKNACSEPGQETGCRECSVIFFVVPQYTFSFFSLITELLHFSQTHGWCECRLHFPASLAARCGHVTKFSPKGQSGRGVFDFWINPWKCDRIQELH